MINSCTYFRPNVKIFQNLIESHNYILNLTKNIIIKQQPGENQFRKKLFWRGFFVICQVVRT